MKKILAEIQGLELRIGEPIEKVALDYKEYKKLHPNTKKTPSDPMFQSQRKAPAQPARTAPKAPAQSARTPTAPAQAPAKAPVQKTKVEHFSDEELRDIGFDPADRKNIRDSEVLDEYNAKKEYDALVKSKKIQPESDPREGDGFYFFMDNYKRKNKEETIEDSQFDPEEFYTALRKNIGYDELHPEKVKAAIKAYNPNLNLTENQIREVIKMYQKRKGR